MEPPWLIHACLCGMLHGGFIGQIWRLVYTKAIGRVPIAFYRSLLLHPMVILRRMIQLQFGMSQGEDIGQDDIGFE